MRLVIAAVAIATMALSACGKKPEADKPSVTVNANGYTVNGAEGSATITTTTSATAVAGQANTPDYASVFPGATVKNVTTTSANGNSVRSVTYITSATPQAVIDFYRPRVAAAGFTTSADANVGVGLMYAAVDAVTQRSMQVIATREKAGTAVVLSWTAPKS